MDGFLIGDIAKRAGVSTATIRYYEEVGLLTPAPRSSAGYRRYTDRTIEEVRFIRKAQALGFSLDEIGEILTLSRAGQTPCEHVLSLAHHHLSAVEERIAQLQKFHYVLAGELAKWDGKTTPTCRGLCQIIASVDEDTEVESPGDLMPRHRART